MHMKTSTVEQTNHTKMSLKVLTHLEPTAHLVISNLMTCLLTLLGEIAYKVPSHKMAFALYLVNQSTTQNFEMAKDSKNPIVNGRQYKLFVLVSKTQ